jgi:hypothetical protein
MILDTSRARYRYKLWPYELVTHTLTLTGTASTGTTSYKINGIPVSYDQTVGPDDDNSIIASLEEAHEASPEASRLAVAASNANVLTLTEPGPGAVPFVITEPLATGGTLTDVDTTVSTGIMHLGLGVAQSADGSAARRPSAADTGVALYGIVCESSNIAANTGDPSIDDHYTVGSELYLLYEGTAPVRVETEITDVAALVYWRVNAPAPVAITEVLGAFRDDDDSASGDVVAVANARWAGTSYYDRQGHLVCLLKVGLI